MASPLILAPAAVVLEEMRIGGINDGKCISDVSFPERMSLYIKAERADARFRLYLKDFSAWLGSAAGRGRMLGFRAYPDEKGGYFERKNNMFDVHLIDNISKTYFLDYAKEMISGNFAHKKEFLRAVECTAPNSDINEIVERYEFLSGLKSMLEKNGGDAVDVGGKILTKNGIYRLKADVDAALTDMAEHYSKYSYGRTLDTADKNGFYAHFHTHPMDRKLDPNKMTGNDLKTSRFLGPSVMVSFYEKKAEVYCGLNGRQMLLIAYPL